MANQVLSQTHKVVTVLIDLDIGYSVGSNPVCRSYNFVRQHMLIASQQVCMVAQLPSPMPATCAAIQALTSSRAVCSM